MRFHEGGSDSGRICHSRAEGLFRGLKDSDEPVEVGSRAST